VRSAFPLTKRHATAKHYQGKQSAKEPEGTVTFDSYIVPSIAQPFDSRTLDKYLVCFGWKEKQNATNY